MKYVNARGLLWEFKLPQAVKGGSKNDKRLESGEAEICGICLNGDELPPNASAETI